MPEPLEVIAAALTEGERGFSYQVGQGRVTPGTFRSDRDRAKEILEALDTAGYDVIKR